MEWNNVWVTDAFPHNGLMVEQLYGTLGIENPTITLVPYLEFFRVAFGINPHPFDANLHTFEGPLVYISQDSGGEWIIPYVRQSARE